MIRKTTQRPTEKTAGPRHPFFIGSRPEPVSCGGIFSSLFGCWQRWLGDLTLRCWLCLCLWGSALVLTGP
uniref:Uncharacterized protein n=1 Tax=Microcebus murinus TaxID=30608 RepID=A0A8C5YJ29_MICMU